MVEAGGNITQQATRIIDVGAHDETFEEYSSSSHEARIGAYAEAGAEAGADSSGEAGADAGAGAGFKASYSNEYTDESETTKTAVTSKFKSGGNITSTSKEQPVGRHRV